jgi:hypothetical protein
MCQAITGLIGEVGENMKLEEAYKGRQWGIGKAAFSSSLAVPERIPCVCQKCVWERVILRRFYAEANSETSLVHISENSSLYLKNLREQECQRSLQP